MKVDLKLTIEIDDEKKIELTEIEAKALYEKLKDLFGGNQVTYIPYQITYPNPLPQQPWITWGEGTDHNPTPPDYTITCHTASLNPSKQGYNLALHGGSCSCNIGNSNS